MRRLLQHSSPLSDYARADGLRCFKSGDRKGSSFEEVEPGAIEDLSEESQTYWGTIGSYFITLSEAEPVVTRALVERVERLRPAESMRF